MNQSKPNTRLLIWFIVGASFFLFLVWHIVIAYDTNQDGNVMVAIMNGFDHMENNPFELVITKSFWKGMGYGLLVSVITFLYFFSINRKTMFGKEQGSAEWATKEDEKKLRDKDFFKNMILTNSVLLSMNTRKTRLNNNILVIGGSGSGKTRFMAKPNTLQGNCSYVITDPKGELLRSTGKMLEDLGYDVKVFNLIEKDHSCCYNPFRYIHKESDVFKLVKQLIKNTNPPDNKGGGDPFWEKSEEALLQAIFFYLWLECSPEQQNFKSVMRLISIAGASEEDENAESELDIMFRLLEEKKGKGYIPCKQYGIFKMASGKTAKSILISVGVRLSVFNLEDIANLTLTDNLYLNTVGNKKTVIYIVIPDSDSSFNFLVSMLYSQLFDELYFQADFGEIKWENDRVVFRSKESLIEKKRSIQTLWNKYSKTKGEKKQEQLKKAIWKCMKQVNKEFGLPFELPDEQLKAEYIKSYVESMDTCLLRIKNRKSTLNDYIGIWKKNKKALKILNQSISQYKESKIEEAERKIAAVEMRIKYEYGIVKKMPPQKHFLWLKKDYTKEDYITTDKRYLEDLKYLKTTLESNVEAYGTRQSFEDKLEKIKGEETRIKKLQKQISETSRRQKGLRSKLHQEIEKRKREIERIRIIAEYEFGVKDLKGKKNGGRLPVPVRCILDEFANIAPIPDFAKLVATMRSREISVTIIIQNISQLKEMYKDNWESLSGNCDTFLFLGGQEQSTLEYVSKKLGKATIDKRSQGKSKGKQGSTSENWDTLGRELMTPDEIGKMDGSKCILFIRGFAPFFGDKFKLEKHPRYELMGETDDSSDPRLYNFKEKFNTKKSALGVHGEQFVNSEFRKLLKQSMDKMIDKLDKQKFFVGNLTEEERVLFQNANIAEPIIAKARREQHDDTVKKIIIKLAKKDLVHVNSLTDETRQKILDELKKENNQEENETLNLFSESNTQITSAEIQEETEETYAPEDDD